MSASSISVQLGQCGTQLGHQLFETIYQDASTHPNGLSATRNEEYNLTALENFFTETQNGKKEAKSVMIDMEQKVVNQVLQSAAKDSSWHYPKGSQLCRKLGSGNNWAYGFQVHGPKCENEILNILHSEVEKCDRLSGFVVLMSLAGGTGSGLGSYVLQLLKDNFANSVVLNPIVAPFKAGEVAVQNFNTLFSLSSAFSDASGSILLKNDRLHNICVKSLLIDKVSLTDLNKVASHQLASILQPSNILSRSRTDFPHRDILFDIVRSSSCHSHYKLLNLRCLPHLAETSIPFSTFSWPGLLKNMKQMLITNFFVDEGMNWQTQTSESIPGLKRKPFKSISNILILRGESACSRSQSWDDLAEFKKPGLYAPWLPERDRCHLWSVNRPFRSYEKSVSMLSNDSSCTEGLDMVIRKAWDMFSSKAYLHQYTKYGLEEEDFLNAFIKVDNVLNSYRKLASL